MATKVFRSHILMCAGTACVSCGTFKVRERLEKELKDRGLDEEVKVVITGCNGFCAEGPIAVVYPEGIFYGHLKPEYMAEIVQEHILKGRPVPKYFYKEPVKKQAIPKMKDIPFFGLQVLRVLRNRGLINPESIEEYIAKDGYVALHKALTQMTPEQIIAEMKESGLRGRGGAGFPTGDKWEESRKYNRFPKYVICNGDEGDPGAFMDRSVLEADPHAVLEGMAICARSIDSHEGYLYIRAQLDHSWMYRKSKRTISSKSRDLPETIQDETAPGLTCTLVFCHSSSRSYSKTWVGRGPTKLMSPLRMLHSCGSSSRLNRRRMRPTAVTRGS